ncbi:MAG: NAD-dependent epimerase/dehydratase family protein [Candidatus Paralactobacillus gallistercoris]|uniref:NAD-dependent epimerase/dehydratase family protein n=1 Tax=Candidatus Paralactobacillus gallistercoris TaxID=2838724 RepID=A0A948TJY1_9LACO|nr:NAD-dependent epimerase/dehydratase family protein [Candidatus Paralactobacillus gallistercoris]
MSKVLITGGAGFIGSNLADRLIKDNDQIVIVDDFSMGLRENIPDSQLITTYQANITDKVFMKDLLLSEHFDYIYMFAGIASVADSVERPYETHQTNQEANVYLLEVLRKYHLPVKKVLFASSAAVYGNDPHLPKLETSTIDPLTPYAIDKFATERYLMDYGRLYNIPTVATRFFNIYGPKQNPSSPYSGVLSIISDCIKQGKTFNLYGDGQQVRDFVYIDDVIDALLLLTKESDINHEVFNVAAGVGTTLNDVIRAYEHAAGKNLAVNYLPERVGDIKYSYADITKLRQLGFKPKYNIESGIAKYWQYINQK